jgi:uncharacterized membrane protein YoaK (UPF0700 family)
MVNISGVLSVKVLTTNVTGHFAYFAEELAAKRYFSAFVFLLYILCFLFGSFLSNFLIELVAKKNVRISHVAPMVIEILLLAGIGIWGNCILNGQIIACILLFTMGMQNSLVTMVSQATVRTTHLTGLFTDLGIELSQLFFYRETQEQFKLKKSIYLRLAIITFFFTGCVSGGYLYNAYSYKTLLFAAVCLIMAAFYDNLLARFYVVKRKIRDL